MTPPPIPDGHDRPVVLDNLMSGGAAHQTLAPGITVGTLHAGNRPGLALHVARQALQTGQLQRALERRFDQAVAYDGFFIYLDAQGALVIWHALPAPHGTLDKTISRMLSLANLEALDSRSTR
ncbi:transcriptional regulator [Pseudomonas sp. S1_E04]